MFEAEHFNGFMESIWPMKEVTLPTTLFSAQGMSNTLLALLSSYVSKSSVCALVLLLRPLLSRAACSVMQTSSVVCVMFISDY